MKGVDERTDEGILQWFCYMQRMENDRNVKRVYIGACVGTRSVGRPRKKWINTMKDCLKQRVFMSGKQGKRYMIEVNDGVF